MEEQLNILPVTTPEQAANQAKEQILLERTGIQHGLMTRYPKLNIAHRKWFRFNNVYLLAGLSGSGKSYLMNTFIEDFLDYIKSNSINGNIDFIPLIFQFCFEMSSHTEIIRACANDLGVNYNYILSSHYDKNTKEYNTLTDEELQKVENYLNHYKRKSILFFETAGNLNMIYNTVLHYYNIYKNKGAKNNKKYKIVVNIDHSLLIERLGEKSERELMARLGKIAIRLRKEFGAMVFIIGQLNNNIETTDRILKSAMHYPIKSDIYAQGQLYNACDSVMTIHQPALLKISEYGPKKIPTAGLIHLQMLKARHGSIGSVWLRNELHTGKIVPYEHTVEEDSDALTDSNL